ncbi:hypothetical protein BDZ91DRAFT_657087 [Kalaharituber pfeilii]|nr:hypothetical protein BDZ91DRAFT_657087 [Kalaharituber pfeilii]
MSSTNTSPGLPTTTLHHPQFPTIPIHVPHHLFPSRDELATHKPNDHPLLAHHPFTTWLTTLTSSFSHQSSPSHPFNSQPYFLKDIHVNHIDFFGSGPKKRIGFVNLSARVENGAGETLPGVVFLRGGSVAVLVIIREHEDKDGDEWVVLTSQPRVAAGALRFLEIPAGMIDDASGAFTGTAAREVQEELGIDIDGSKLIDLAALALSYTPPQEEGIGRGEVQDAGLQEGMYPSPGGCDEFIKLYAYVHAVPKGGIRELQGRVGGNWEEGERIVVRVVRERDVWRVAGRDGKTLAAWALWRGLREVGAL